jgi:hypothetical protein
MAIHLAEMRCFETTSHLFMLSLDGKNYWFGEDALVMLR